MVLQRWQTVWLFVAAVLVIVFCFVPMAIVSDVDGTMIELAPIDMPGFTVVNLLIAVLLLIAIFLYKNSHRQKTVTLVSILLTLALGASEAVILFHWESEVGPVQWLGSIFLLLGAVVFAAMAYRGISHDEKLLRAADRLR
jgi:peptidoglycan/LPS O-acetylase OafA/YrhL